MALLTALTETPPEDAPPSQGARLRAEGGWLGQALVALRRGLPCVLRAEGVRLAVAAAEMLRAESLATLVGWGGAERPVLLLAPSRAVALGPVPAMVEDVVAFEVAEAALDPARLLGFADPTAPQAWTEGDLSPVAWPPGASAALKLAKLARLLPAMLVMPIAAGRETGTVPVVEASEIVAAWAARGRNLVRVGGASVPLADAPDCRVEAFRATSDGMEHLAILVGRPDAIAAPLVRIHSECFTGDLLGSLRCDCGPQLRGAMRRMAEEGAGVVLYLAQEGRGIGLVNKLRAYALQDRGMDTLDANEALGWGADERDFGLAATMLQSLGLTRVRLLTNNPRKLAALADGGIVVERVSHLFASNGVNDSYLAAKVGRFGHLAD